MLLCDFICILNTNNPEPKKWGLFAIVGKYSSGVKMTFKGWFTPMETTKHNALSLKTAEAENKWHLNHEHPDSLLESNVYFHNLGDHSKMMPHNIGLLNPPHLSLILW